MNEQDQERIIAGLSQALTKAITTALRDLVQGVGSQSSAGASSLQLPGGGTSATAEGWVPPVDPERVSGMRPMENPFFTPSTEPPATPQRPLSPPLSLPSASMPPEEFGTPQPPPPVVTNLTLPTSPIAADPIPSPLPHPPLDTESKLDFKRGFSTDDPTGRIVFAHEQTAQANRYDQTTDMLYESLVQQSRTDRDYRTREYDLLRRILQDSNNDYRRIDDLERRHECSRETITDVNL